MQGRFKHKGVIWAGDAMTSGINERHPLNKTNEHLEDIISKITELQA